MSGFNIIKNTCGSYVRPDQAQREASERYNLGNSSFCAAGSGSLNFDIYGRPASQNTLRVMDSDCSNCTEWSANKLMYYETNGPANRPHLSIADPGNGCVGFGVGNGDLMSKGRDLIPNQLYDGSMNTFINPAQVAPGHLPAYATSARCDCC